MKEGYIVMILVSRNGKVSLDELLPDIIVHSPGWPMLLTDITCYYCVPMPASYLFHNLLQTSFGLQTPILLASVCLSFHGSVFALRIFPVPNLTHRIIAFSLIFSTHAFTQCQS